MKANIPVLVAMLLVVPPFCLATPITVSGGQIVVFNFDFVAAGANPAPPYIYGMELFTQMSFSAPLPTGSWEMYADLDATGIPTITGPGAGLVVLWDPYPGPGLHGWEDGVFSWKLSVTSGSLTVDPYVIGFRELDFKTGPVYPTSSQIPEPTSLILLGPGLGMIGLAAWCRRK